MEKYDEKGNLKKEYYNKSNGLWYELRGDYYYPMIVVPKNKNVILKKYSRAIILKITKEAYMMNY